MEFDMAESVSLLRFIERRDDEDYFLNIDFYHKGSMGLYKPKRSSQPLLYLHYKCVPSLVALRDKNSSG